jgi:hypothetical protein
MRSEYHNSPMAPEATPQPVKGQSSICGCGAARAQPDLGVSLQRFQDVAALKLNSGEKGKIEERGMGNKLVGTPPDQIGEAVFCFSPSDRFVKRSS